LADEGRHEGASDAEAGRQQETRGLVGARRQQAATTPATKPMTMIQSMPMLSLLGEACDALDVLRRGQAALRRQLVDGLR